MVNLDGYIIPKNDEYFSDQIMFLRQDDSLKFVTNFSGPTGFAVILKGTKTILFVDGRYTTQAEHIQTNENF